MRAPADYKNEINECFLKYKDDPEVMYACKVMAEMSKRRGISYYDCWYAINLELEMRERARAWVQILQTPKRC